MKIVCISIGMTSAFNSSLELCRRLSEAGHEVTYLSHVDLEEQVKAHGHGFELLVGDLSRQQQAGEAPAWGNLRRPGRFVSSLRGRRRQRREAILDREVEEAVIRLDPDLLLIDIEMHVAIVKTARLGLPTVLLMSWFSVFRRPGLPPLHTHHLPADSMLERWKLVLAWWRLRLETLHMEWRNRWHRFLRADLFPPIPYDTVEIRDLRAVARAWSFPYRRRTSRAHWLRPWLYTDLPIFSFNAEETDYPGAAPTDSPFFYLGPMMHRQRVETPMSAVDRAAWKALLEARAESTEPPPLVYCSLGTLWAADRAFLGKVVEVARRRTDLCFVIGLGGTLAAVDFEVGALDAGGLGSIPSNLLILSYAPQLQVLREAAVAIVHGGSGTLNECLLQEVPMVVYSTKFVDQNGNAAHLAYHGLGILGDKDVDDAETVESKIEEALEDGELRARVRAMAERLRRYEDPSILEQALASVLSSARTEPRISQEVHR